MNGYDFANDPEVSWEIILTPEALEENCREWADQKMFGWDVETSGMSSYHGARIIGHAAAWRRPNGQIRAIYIPCRHESYAGLFDAVRQLDPELVTAAVKPALEGPALKGGHNLPFDIQMAWADGIDVAAPVHCSLIMARIFDENQKNNALPTVLERLRIKHQRGWKDFIKPDIQAQMKALGLKKKELLNRHGYKYVTIPRLGFYAVQDAAYEFRLTEAQLPYAGQWADEWKMEMDLIWAACDIQRVGVPLDCEHLNRVAQEQQAEMDRIAVQVWQLAGEQFEITNDNMVRQILFHKLGLPSQGKTKGGKNKEKVDRVDEDALWALDRQGAAIAGLIRQYNAKEKVVSTYTHGLTDLVDPHGILHGQFNQNKAVTGRASMSNPNLQNIPTRTELGRKVKAAFVARPGKIRYCIDYSQVELRVLAHLSQDPLLLKVYHQGLDVHRNTAIEAFGTADKVDGIDMRRVAKILNFGIPFGITSMGVQRNINKDLPAGVPPIDEPRADGYLDAWFRNYAGVDRWRRSFWYQAQQNGGLIWNMFGLPRRVPWINSDQRWQVEQAQRQLTSTAVQGGAAGIVKRSMVKVYQYLKSQTHCEADLVLMVHDDLQFDMEPEGSAHVVREIKRIMEDTCQKAISVPLVADVEYFTTNWSEKKGEGHGFTMGG